MTCTATDGSGNTDSGSFTVTVTPYVGPPPPGPGPPPTGAPVLSVPSGVSVEATGPSGSVVNYGFVSASDGEDGQLPASCSPASGQTFPLGQTTVTCSATDSDGHTATKSFVVSVTDHTDPVLQLPPDLWIQTTEASLPRTDSRITTFLGAAAADDLVDSDPAIAHNAPATLPAGETVITFTATDSSGNTATGTAKVTISPDPPPPGGDDRRPPANVSNIKAKLGDKSVRITWKNPADGDFDHVLVSRQPGKSGEPSSVVYEGKGASLVDKGLEVGTQYRYLLVTYDRAGNHPAGVAVVAVGRRQLLRRPADGAVVRRPPTLGWVRISGAGYYNVQLWYAPEPSVGRRHSVPEGPQRLADGEQAAARASLDVREEALHAEARHLSLVRLARNRISPEQRLRRSHRPQRVPSRQAPVGPGRGRRRPSSMS